MESHRTVGLVFLGLWLFPGKAEIWAFRQSSVSFCKATSLLWLSEFAVCWWERQVGPEARHWCPPALGVLPGALPRAGGGL